MGTTVTIRWDEFSSNIIIKWHYAALLLPPTIYSNHPNTTTRRLPRLAYDTASREFGDNVSLWYIDDDDVRAGGREGRVAWLPAWFDSVGLPRDSLTVCGTGRKRSVVRWNGIKIAYVHIFPSPVPVCLSVVVTPPPRGLSFSLATQLICTNYSLLIEITLNQSIRGEWVWLLNNYIALRCNLFRMCRANWIFCQH